VCVIRNAMIHHLFFQESHAVKLWRCELWTYSSTVVRFRVPLNRTTNRADLSFPLRMTCYATSAVLAFFAEFEIGLKNVQCKWIFLRITFHFSTSINIIILLYLLNEQEFTRITSKELCSEFRGRFKEFVQCNVA